MIKNKMIDGVIDMEFKPVALIGFMGSGKTTVGRATARELGAAFSDLDSQIESISGMRVPEIFDTLGEEGLRNLESLALGNIITFVGVIATTSSCIMIPRNRKMIEDNYTVFYLDADFHYLYPRVAGTGRPLLKALSKIELEKLFDLRRPLYKSCTDYILDATKPVEDLVSEILDKVIIDE